MTNKNIVISLNRLKHYAFTYFYTILTMHYDEDVAITKAQQKANDFVNLLINDDTALVTTIQICKKTINAKKEVLLNDDRS